MTVFKAVRGGRVIKYVFVIEGGSEGERLAVSDRIRGEEIRGGDGRDW